MKKNILELLTSSDKTYIWPKSYHICTDSSEDNAISNKMPCTGSYDVGMTVYSVQTMPFIPTPLLWSRTSSRLPFTPNIHFNPFIDRNKSSSALTQTSISTFPLKGTNILFISIGWSSISIFPLSRIIISSFPLNEPTLQHFHWPGLTFQHFH